MCYVAEYICSYRLHQESLESSIICTEAQKKCWLYFQGHICPFAFTLGKSIESVLFDLKRNDGFSFPLGHFRDLQLYQLIESNEELKMKK